MLIPLHFLMSSRLYLIFQIYQEMLSSRLPISIELYHYVQVMFGFLRGWTLTLTLTIIMYLYIFIAVYTAYEVVGWYAVGIDMLPVHMNLHKQIETNLVQNPLFLLLNPSILSIESKLLPIRIFETVRSSVPGSNDQNIVFVDASFRLETGQVEKLAVDEVTKASSGDGSSAIELQNQAMTSSVLTLGEKISTILKILKAMQSGKVPSDPSLLRRASKMVRYLHTSMAGKELDSTLIDQIDECFMITYLSSATKAAAHICEIADTYSMVYSDRLGTSV